MNEENKVIEVQTVIDGQKALDRKDAQIRDVYESNAKLEKKITRRNIVILVEAVIIILLLLRACGLGGNIFKVDETCNCECTCGCEDCICNHVEPEVTPKQPDNFGTGVDPNAGDKIEGKSTEEIQAELNEKLLASYITMSMNVSPNVINGSANLQIDNVENNNYPIVVQLFLEDGTKIYESAQIPVGKSIENADLFMPLEPGVYNGIARFHNVDETTGNSL